MLLKIDDVSFGCTIHEQYHRNNRTTGQKSLRYVKLCHFFIRL